MFHDLVAFETVTGKETPLENLIATGVLEVEVQGNELLLIDFELKTWKVVCSTTFKAIELALKIETEL